MEPELGLRRHQTTAVRQPTVTQRLQEILRNRRINIGRSNTTHASSVSELRLFFLFFAYLIRRLHGLPVTEPPLGFGCFGGSKGFT